MFTHSSFLSLLGAALEGISSFLAGGMKNLPSGSWSEAPRFTLTLIQVFKFYPQSKTTVLTAFSVILAFLQFFVCIILKMFLKMMV